MQTKVKRRAFAALGLACAVTSALSPHAHAQRNIGGGGTFGSGWRIVKIKGTGNVSASGLDTASGPWNLESPNSNGTVDLSSYGAPDYGSPPAGYSGSSSISTNGSFKVILRWFGNGTPTPKCALKVQSFADASVTLGVGHPGTPPRQVSANAGGGAGGGGVQNAGHDESPQKLIQVDTSGYSAGPDGPEVECDLHLSPSASASLSIAEPDRAGDHDLHSSLGAQVRAMAWLDSRSVMLNRSSAIGEHTGLVNGVPTTYGDTIYSHVIHSPYSFPDTFTNWQEFVPNLSGSWSNPMSGYQWESGLPSADEQYDFAIYKMPLGQLELYPRNSQPDSTEWRAANGGAPTGSPTQATVTYTMTDADGATATAKYVLTIHEPVELIHDNQSNVFSYVPAWGTDPTSNNGGILKIDGYVGASQRTLTISKSHSEGFSFTVSGDLSAGEVGPAFGFSDTTSTEEGTSTDVSSYCPEVPAGQYAIPVKCIKYTRHDYTFRHYTTAGEHVLDEVEAPPGSGYYDKPVHEQIQDIYVGGDITWELYDSNKTVPNVTTQTPPTTTPPSSHHFS